LAVLAATGEQQELTVKALADCLAQAAFQWTEMHL
jgi:hypothetical protein